MSAPDFETLVNHYMDGTARAEEVAHLNARLREGANVRRDFAEVLNLDAALSDLAAGWTPVARKVVAFPSRLRWLAAAASVALLAVTGWWWQTQGQVFATVANAMGVTEFATGASLHGESHEITAGTVEFITLRGARVVIEAPAAFRFESAQRLRMMHGRAAADVPPSAKGFTVMTPTGNAVDLGTKFGVDVPREGNAEIHVFQGEVIAQPGGGAKRRSLRDGQALALQTGSGVVREMRDAAFIRPDEISALSAGLAQGQQAHAGAALAALRQDPALITLLDFESPSNSPGAYRVVQGRWPGSHAGEFVNVGDHMKVDVGGEHEWPQLTLAAWVRIDRLGAPYQSLYHTDGWTANKAGQVHWIIVANTTMRLALRQNTLAPGSTERDGYPDSRTPVLPEQGRWVHLAVVYNAPAKTVRFYLNGIFDKETQQETAYPARLGPAQIGNWDSKDRKLSGRVDEMIILGRAMSDAEVHALYVAGNPYL